jgi:hypothetical protein
VKPRDLWPIRGGSRARLAPAWRPHVVPFIFAVDGDIVRSTVD